MTFYYTILLFVVLLACVATLYTDGMWSNAIRLINVVTAALLATNFFEPAARWLDDWEPSYTYVWDFLALWGLFGLFMTIFGELTDRVSQVKVRFLKIADRIGSRLLALWIGWVMVCFTMMTLHTAPLGRTFLFDNFKAEERMFMGLPPTGNGWRSCRRCRWGAFCRSGQDQKPDGKCGWTIRTPGFTCSIRMRSLCSSTPRVERTSRPTWPRTMHIRVGPTIMRTTLCVPAFPTFTLPIPKTSNWPRIGLWPAKPCWG